MYTQAPATLPTRVFTSDATVPFMNRVVGKTPMLVKPPSTRVAARNGMSPAMIAVLTPGPNRGRMEA